MQFGCFVQLQCLKKPWEGLVHISNLRKEGRVSLVSDVVSRHQKVKVKCISITGVTVGLSIKDVDQKTGEDLNPQHTKRLLTQQQSTNSNESNDNEAARNPDRPHNWNRVPVAEEDLTAKKKVKQISDFEKLEIKQLIAAKAIKWTEMPDFDPDNGILQKEDDSDEDIEIEVIDDESVFLKGRNKQSLMDSSPVKIVKNPDGSLSQAAMMQGALAKERREIKIAAQQAEIKSADNEDDGEIARPDDPFAYKQEAAATGNKGYQLTEWKKSLLTGSKGSYGKKTTLSIIEQREGPIYRLKDELI
jgi:ATP-dependent RNA helicase DHX8/PRP22